MFLINFRYTKVYTVLYAVLNTVWYAGMRGMHPQPLSLFSPAPIQTDPNPVIHKGLVQLVHSFLWITWRVPTKYSNICGYLDVNLT